MPETPPAESPTREGDQWPEGWDTWPHEQRREWIIQLFRKDRDYVPTPKERAEAAHMADKMASASGWNQVDPNAD